MTRGHNFKPHLLFPWVDEIVHAPEVLDAVEDLIGPDIRLFHLSVWPKDAGTGTYVSWHQDATYFALDPICHVTAWVALTDAPVESGCMEVVPGSHRLGQLPHAEMQDPRTCCRAARRWRRGRPSQTAYMAVKAGQFSLHHTHLVHNSRPNRSTTAASGSASATSRPRRAAPSPTRVTAMLVRGEDTYGHFDEERRPPRGRPGGTRLPRRGGRALPAMNAVESSENKIAVVKTLSRGPRSSRRAHDRERS